MKTLTFAEYAYLLKQMRAGRTAHGAPVEADDPGLEREIQLMFYVNMWNAGDCVFRGPFDSAEAANAWCADNEECDGFEFVAIVGPLPLLAMVKGWFPE